MSGVKWFETKWRVSLTDYLANQLVKRIRIDLTDGAAPHMDIGLLVAGQLWRLLQRSTIWGAMIAPGEDAVSNHVMTDHRIVRWRFLWRMKLRDRRDVTWEVLRASSAFQQTIRPCTELQIITESVHFSGQGSRGVCTAGNNGASKTPPHPA